MCVGWPMCFLCCVFAIIWDYRESKATSLESTGGEDPQPVAKVGSEEKATMLGKNQVAPDQPEPKNSMRRLTDDDLCDELIPGLRVRVLASFLQKRWYEATAVRYDKEAGSVFVEFDKETMSNNVVRTFLQNPHMRNSVTIYKIADGCIRLHEDALSHVAKKRILQGLIQASLFNGTTFDTLDTNQNGFLDRTELQNGLQSQGISLDDVTLDALMTRLDTNIDGKLSANEFRNFLAKDGHP